MAVILFFIDGVGVGELNPDFNPLAHSETGIFNSNSDELPHGGRQYQPDACLDIDGLPQSASGQTTIYTGINAAQKTGKHLFGFPNHPLRKLLHEDSLFLRLKHRGVDCRFLNAFRPVFFTSPELFRHMRMSATTEMNRAAGLPFVNVSEIADGAGLYHDFTNESLIRLGFTVPEITPEEAGEVIRSRAAQHDLVLYEYFLTDYAGHRSGMREAIREVHKVERVLMSLLGRMDLTHDHLIVISDHGNLEDTRVRTHTYNPSFMGVWGPRVCDNDLKFNDLTEVAPFIESIFSGPAN
jgi:2,3-bisphosphoglycerate-independent phosphoglycerate mutase